MLHRIALVLALLGLVVSGARAQETKEEREQRRAREIQEQAKERARVETLPGGKYIPPPLYQDETPEERKARLGTADDPGPDPDPNKVWHRFGKNYTIHKFLRRSAVYDQAYGWVRPTFALNIGKEIYQENEEFVWVWLEQTDLIMPPPEHYTGIPRTHEYEDYTTEQLGYVLALKEEMTELPVKVSDRVVRFKESSAGLPDKGNWRNALDVADMNEDGHVDLVLPPQRGAVGAIHPYIYLGNGAGEWKLWDAPKWPRRFNYGTVVAADLNNDRHQDIVVAQHLVGLAVLLGDGKGGFTDSSAGLPGDFPTRRAIVTDLDRDGDLDIVAISEGATLAQDNIAGSPLRAYLNDGKAKSWTFHQIAEDGRDVAGDWLTTGNFDGDKFPDLVGSSIIYHGVDLMYLNKDGRKFEPFGRGWLPFYSYYGAMTAGKFSSAKRDDIIIGFGRIWPMKADPEKIPPPDLKYIRGIERISFTPKGAVRTPILRWYSDGAIWGMAKGDFDGDGKLDVLYHNSSPYEYVLLLGDGKGGFRKASLEGFETPDLTIYDIKVADVNADKRPDVILMFEARSGSQAGVKVFLNQGAGTRM